MNKTTLGGVLPSLIAAALIAGPGIAGSSAAPIESTTVGPYAYLRAAHFSPDTPGVDVYLTAVAGGVTRLWLSDVGYGDVSPYRRLAAGLYAASMRAHGAAATSPPALRWTLHARAGHAYTAAGVGINKQLRGVILRDDLTPPGAQQGRVRVIQAASRAPQARVVAQNGDVLARSAAFATSTAYTSVPAGTVRVRARSLADPSVAAAASVRIASGSVNSVVLLDGKGGGITIRALIDAAGAATMPVGSAPGGGGGTARRPDDVWTDGALLGVLALALVGVGVIVRRVRTQTPQ
jgi:hypothetical protein